MSKSPFNPWIEALPRFTSLPTADLLERQGRRQGTALLHLNECAFEPPPHVKAALQAAATGEINRYAEANPQRLAGLLAARCGVTPDRIVIGAGSEELLQAAAIATLSPGARAVLPHPSFPRYRTATLAMGAEPRLIRLSPDGRNDVEGMIAAIDASTRLVFACTPNNPSGAPLSQPEIVRLVSGTPDDVLLVMDEAYSEFDAHEGGAGALEALQARRGPWLSMRTLSKAYALAGLRVGYAIASDPEVAGVLLKVKMTFNISRLAIAGAEAALVDSAYARDIVATTVEERERLAAGLADLGFSPLPSRTNFVSFDLGAPAGPLIAALEARGFLVRDWRAPGYESFVRVTVGSKGENDRLLSVLRSLVAQA